MAFTVVWGALCPITQNRTPLVERKRKLSGLRDDACSADSSPCATLIERLSGKTEVRGLAFNADCTELALASDVTVEVIAIDSGKRVWTDSRCSRATTTWASACTS